MTAEWLLPFEKFYDMPVKNIMNRNLWDLPLIAKDADVAHVISILTGREHLWVVDSMENLKLVGVITLKNLLEILAPEMPHPYSSPSSFLKTIRKKMVCHIDDIMTKRPIWCKPTDKLRDVLSLMKKYRFRRIPVLENGKILGEITLKIIIAVFGKTSAFQAGICPDPITPRG